MRAITRRLRKVQFFRETQADGGLLLSHSETTQGLPIVRASTPRPEPVASDGQQTQPMALLIDDSLEREIFS